MEHTSHKSRSAALSSKTQKATKIAGKLCAVFLATLLTTATVIPPGLSFAAENAGGGGSEQITQEAATQLAGTKNPSATEPKDSDGQENSDDFVESPDSTTTPDFPLTKNTENTASDSEALEGEEPSNLNALVATPQTSVTPLAVAPTITSVTPDIGHPAGGNTVTIAGSGFYDRTITGFTQIPSITFPGNQYLNTGISYLMSDNEIQWTFDAAIARPTVDQIGHGNGIFWGPGTRTWRFYIQALTQPPSWPNTIIFGLDGALITMESTNDQSRHSYHIRYNRSDAAGYYYVDTKTENTFSNPAPTANTGNLYLGALSNGNSSFIRYAKQTVYGSKFWKEGALVLDLVPVRRDADSRVGFLDELTGDFYMQPTGAGAFTRVPAAVAPLNLTVTFGANAATYVDVLSDTQLTCTVPASTLPTSHNEGVVDVSVGTAAATRDTLSNSYTYREQMSITSVLPASGLIPGGETVIISGHNFWSQLVPDFTDGSGGQYMQMDYLNFTGQQYINTGVLNNGVINYDIDYALNRLSNGNYVLGAYQSNPGGSWQNGLCYIANAVSSATLYTSIYTTTSGNGYSIFSDVNSGAFATPDLNRHKITKNGAILMLDNNPTRSYTSTFGNNALVGTYPIYLGALNRAGTASGGYTGKIYGAKIYYGSTLQTDLVPAYNIATGATGMWDTVSQTFKESSSATPFAPIYSVTFGGDAATITAWTNDSITVTTPGHAPGKVDVVVNNGVESATWTVALGGYEYLANVDCTINYVTESIDGLDSAHNPSANTWFYTTDPTIAAGTTGWTNITSAINSGSISLTDLGSAPNDAGAGTKTLYLAYATSAGANQPNSNVGTRVIKERPAAPSGLSGGVDEIIGGLTTQEFRLSTSTGNWIDIAGDPQSTGASYGNYDVRVKAVASHPTAYENNGDFRSPVTTVKVYAQGTISINGDNDLTFTYPHTFATNVTPNTVTVTTNTATPTWYYMDSVANPTKPATTDSGWTPYNPSTPPACGEYWVYADVIADTGANDYHSYAISAVIKVTWEKKLLTVGGLSFSKVYDATTNATATGVPTLTFSASGAPDTTGQAVYGDDVSIANGTGGDTPIYAYSTKDANVSGTTVSLTSGGYVLAGAQAGYYALPSTYTWTGIITARPVAVSFTGVGFEKPYDRTSVATISSGEPSLAATSAGPTASGPIDANVSLQTIGVTYFYGTNNSTPTVSASAAANQSVYITAGTQNNFTLGGADKANYQLVPVSQALPVVTNGQILRIAIDPTDLVWTIDNVDPAPSPLAIDHDGSTHTLTATVSAAKLASALDVVTVTLSGNYQESAVNVSPGYTATADNNTSGTLDGADGANYYLSSSAQQTWQILSAPPGPPGTPSATGLPSNTVLAWTAPGFDGGVAITSYQVEYVVAGLYPTNVDSTSNSYWSGTSAITSVTLTGSTLAETYTVPFNAEATGNTYAVRVRASNNGGSSWGAWSDNGQMNINRETPVLSAPTIVIPYGTELGAVTLGGSSFSATVPPGSHFTPPYSASEEIFGSWEWDYAADNTNANTIPTVHTTHLTLHFTPVNTSIRPDNTTDFNTQTITATVQVTPKPLTIDFSDLAFSRVYDGTTQANSGKTGSVSFDSADLVGTDVVTVTDSGVNYIYSQADVGTGLNVTVANDSSVSNLILQGPSQDNYAIANLPVTTGSPTVISNTGVITAYPLTFSWTLDGSVTSEPYTTTFNGATHNMVASATGVAGESVTADTYQDSGTTVASARNANATDSQVYSAQVDTIKVTGGQAKATNYSFSALTSASHASQNWHISKAAVAVVWTTSSFTYNGASQAPTATYVPMSGDTDPAVFDSSVISGPTTAGSAIDAGSYTASATDNTNYQPLTGSLDHAFTIDPKAITLDFSSLDLTQFPYSGQNVYSVTTATMPDILTGQVASRDSVTLSVGTAKWQLSGADVGSGYKVEIDGDFALTGLGAGNYVISASSGSYVNLPIVSAGIDPRTVKLSWTVDGTPVTTSALAYSPSASLTALSATATVNALASGVSTLANSSTEPYVIVYDGKEHTVAATITNIVTGDIVAIDAYTGTTAAQESGSYIAEVNLLGGIDAVNYTLTGAENTDFYWRIDPAPGPDPSPSPDTPDDGSNLPGTGDDPRLIILSAVMASAGVLFLVLYLFSHQRRKRKW